MGKIKERLSQKESKKLIIWFMIVSCLFVGLIYMIYYVHYSVIEKQDNLTETKENTSQSILNQQNVNKTSESIVAEQKNLSYIQKEGDLNVSTTENLISYCAAYLNSPYDLNSEMYPRIYSYGNISPLPWNYFSDFPKNLVNAYAVMNGGLIDKIIPIDIKEENGSLTIYAIRPHLFDEATCEPIPDIGFYFNFGLNLEKEKKIDEIKIKYVNIYYNPYFKIIHYSEKSTDLKFVNKTPYRFKFKLEEILNKSIRAGNYSIITDHEFIYSILTYAEVLRATSGAIMKIDDEKNRGYIYFHTFGKEYEIEKEHDYVKIFSKDYGNILLKGGLKDKATLLEFLNKETKREFANANILKENESQIVIEKENEIVFIDLLGNSINFDIYELKYEYILAKKNEEVYWYADEKDLLSLLKKNNKIFYNRCFSVLYKENETYGNGTLPISYTHSKDEIVSHCGTNPGKFSISWKFFEGKTENMCKNKIVYFKTNAGSNAKAIISNVYVVYDDTRNNTKGLRIFPFLVPCKYLDEKCNLTTNYTLEINFSEDVDFVEIIGVKLCKDCRDKDKQIYERIECKKD